MLFLPIELWTMILSFCDIKSFGNLLLSIKDFHHLPYISDIIQQKRSKVIELYLIGNSSFEVLAGINNSLVYDPGQECEKNIFQQNSFSFDNRIKHGFCLIRDNLWSVGNINDEYPISFVSGYYHVDMKHGIWSYFSDKTLVKEVTYSKGKELNTKIPSKEGTKTYSLYGKDNNFKELIKYSFVSNSGKNVERGYYIPSRIKVGHWEYFDESGILREEGDYKYYEPLNGNSTYINNSGYQSYASQYEKNCTDITDFDDKFSYYGQSHKNFYRKVGLWKYYVNRVLSKTSFHA